MKSWYFEISKTVKPLARLIKKRERAHVNKIKGKKRSQPIPHRKTKDHRDYLQLYANKMDNIEKSTNVWKCTISQETIRKK